MFENDKFDGYLYFYHFYGESLQKTERDNVAIRIIKRNNYLFIIFIIDIKIINIIDIKKSNSNKSIFNNNKKNDFFFIIIKINFIILIFLSKLSIINHL